MTETTHLIDELKEKLNLSSDYALAKKLGITVQRMSNYRTGRNAFDDLIAYQVAELLERDPAEVVARIQLERAKKPQERAAWQKILERISSTAAVILIVLGGLTKPGDALANQSDISANVDYKNERVIYIMRIIADVLELLGLLPVPIPSRR